MTTRFRFLLALVAALTTFGTAAAQQVYSLHAPPADIEDHLDALRAGKERGVALRALTARDDAAPYLRHELTTTKDKSLRVDLQTCLKPIEERIAKRNLKRVNEWVKGRRFDLYAEMLSTYRGSDAVDVADLIFPIQKDTTTAAEKAAGLTAGKLQVQPSDTRFAKEHPNN